MSNNKGFTLIELLIVIAIIGILSSMVLNSLSTARTRSLDTAIKSDASGLRSAAELYYSTNSSYGTQAYTADCGGTVAGVFGDTTIQRYIDDAITKSGQTAATAAKCNANDTYYVFAVQLRSSSSNGWCVDNSGNSKQITWTGYTAARTACP